STVSAVAGFSGCSIDKAGHGYRLLATLDGSSGRGTALSAPFDIGVGSPAQLVFTSTPAAGTGGVSWTKQPVVTVEDAGGNPVSTATGDVHLAITASTGSGTLNCQDATIPLQLGRAQFADCAIDKTALAYSLTATWTTFTGVSPTFPITAG